MALQAHTWLWSSKKNARVVWAGCDEFTRLSKGELESYSNPSLHEQSKTLITFIAHQSKSSLSDLNLWPYFCSIIFVIMEWKVQKISNKFSQFFIADHSG